MPRVTGAAFLFAAFLAIFAACLPAAEGEKSEAAAKAAEAFESLYGKDWTRVKSTSDVRDDIELAKKLLAAAKEAKDQPEFLAILCEKACELAANPMGYATAAEALQLEAAGVPEKASAVAARLLEIRQKQFDASKGDDRAAAGEALMEALLPVADAREKVRDAAGTAVFLRRALAAATVAKSDRRTQIEARLKTLEQSLRTAREIEDIKRLLEADPNKMAARERLVRLYLVDLDDPAQAAKWVQGVEDTSLRKYVPGAAKPVADAPEYACLDLGEWYRGLAENAPVYAQAAMFARARAYLERFLETHPTKDLDRTRATVALGKVNESIANLAAQPPKPTPREKPAKPEPGTVGPGRWIDLAPLVDPARDVAEGKAERAGAALKIFSAANMRMTVSLVAQGDYEAEFAFKRTWGPGQVSFTLPVGPADVTLIVGGVAGSFSGLEKINGLGAEKNDTVIRPSKFDNDRLYVVAVRVQTSGGQARIETLLDGSPFVQWSGPVSALSASYQVAARGCFGLGCWGAGYTFERARVRMLSGTARLQRAADLQAGPSASAAIKPGQWIDLVAGVDPDKDAVAGTWQRKDVLALVKSCDRARLALPWQVAGDYQLKVEFARTRGGADITFILPVGSRSTALILGKEGGARSGLFWAGGNSCDLVKPAPVENNKVHDLDVTVQTGAGKIRVAVSLDGKPYFDWQGPESNVVIWDAFQLPNNASPGLGSWNGNEIVYKSVQLRMLSGEAKPTRPLAKPAKP